MTPQQVQRKGLSHNEKTPLPNAVSIMPKTKGDQKELWKKSSLLGYFAKLPRECPPKKIQQKAKSPPSKRDTSGRRGSSPTGTITKLYLSQEAQ